MATTALDARPLPRPPLRRQPGYLRRMFADPQPVLDELRDRYGPIVGLGAGPVRMAVVGDPHGDARGVRRPTDSFRWGHKFNVLGFVVGPQSMIVSDGADHKRRRGSVQVAFGRRRLNGWIPMIVDRTDAAVDAPGGVPGRRTRARSTSTRSGGRSCSTSSCGPCSGSGWPAGATRSAPCSSGPRTTWRRRPSARSRTAFPFTARARVRADRQALDRIIDAEIAAPAPGPTGDPLDVLEVLVADGALSDAEIRDQVVTLIGAGFDTTAATLAWMLWCAALSPGLWPGSGPRPTPCYGPVGSAVVARRDDAGRARPRGSGDA